MHCSFFAILAATLPFAFAAPSSTSNVINTTSPGSPEGEYYLMTSVIGDGNKDKDKLYLSGYHTGKQTSLGRSLKIKTLNERQVLA